MKPTQNNPCVESGRKYEYWEKNAVKPSDQFQKYQKTWQECQALCAKTPECKFWTWAGRQSPYHNWVQTVCGMGRWKGNPSSNTAYQQNRRIDYAISGPKFCPKVKFCAKAKLFFTLNTMISNYNWINNCEAQARVRQGSARDGPQSERPQSLHPCLELTLKLVCHLPPPPPGRLVSLN